MVDTGWIASPETSPGHQVLANPWIDLYPRIQECHRVSVGHTCSERRLIGTKLRPVSESATLLEPFTHHLPNDGDKIGVER